MNLVKSASVAYLHYVSFMICFGALVYERALLKINPNKKEAISLILADVIYGIAGIVLLTSGIFRVIKYGQGSDFYTHNPVFWIKIIIFALVGSLSLYPTFNYIYWAIPISKGNLPDVNSDLISRLKSIVSIELIGFSLIPLFATFMARGIGLN